MKNSCSKENNLKRLFKREQLEKIVRKKTIRKDCLKEKQLERVVRKRTIEIVLLEY